jgi:hypothetical protein
MFCQRAQDGARLACRKDQARQLRSLVPGDDILPTHSIALKLRPGRTRGRGCDAGLRSRRSFDREATRQQCRCENQRGKVLDHSGPGRQSFTGLQSKVKANHADRTRANKCQGGYIELAFSAVWKPVGQLVQSAARFDSYTGHGLMRSDRQVDAWDPRFETVQTEWAASARLHATLRRSTQATR